MSTKKQPPRKPTLQVLPPPLTNSPLEDDDLLISHKIAFEEAGLAFDWLESIADLMSVAVTSDNDLGDKTIYNAAWLIEEIAKAGKACWRREQETYQKKWRAARGLPGNGG